MPTGTPSRCYGSYSYPTSCMGRYSTACKHHRRAWALCHSNIPKSGFCATALTEWGSKSVHSTALHGLVSITGLGSQRKNHDIS
eukprot:scaffold4223_cov189-Amphora_coffeaeformis.AAC.50